MADDLDKYLENIGISTDEEETSFKDALPSDRALGRGDEAPPVSQGEEPAGIRGQVEAEENEENVRLEPSLPVPEPAQGSVEERLESFLVNLLLNFDPAYAVELRWSDEGGEREINADIFGGDPGKIIGRGGRTLSALEYVTNTVINTPSNQGGESVRVNIDVGGYKRRRDDRLRENARKAADRVRSSGRAVELEPMSAAERRVIHMALADDPSVRSESSGEGRDRRVVVKPR